MQQAAVEDDLAEDFDDFDAEESYGDETDFY